MTHALEKSSSVRRVGIDCRQLINMRGIGSMISNLLSNLDKTDKQIIYYLYIQDKKLRELIPIQENFVIRYIPNFFYPLWEQILLPLFCIIDKINILHCPANSGPILLPKNIIYLVTIHDLMFMFSTKLLPRSPVLYQSLGRLYLKYLTPFLIDRSDLITTVSNTSMGDILRYFPSSKNKLRVINEAGDFQFSNKMAPSFCNIVMLKYGISKPFFLMLGAADPRKNLFRTVEAFLELINTYDLDVFLVITGVNPKLNNRICKLFGSNRAFSSIKFLPFVSKEELISLFQMGQALLYPSLYEGFGLPVYDAMLSNLPVIASRCGALSEIDANSVAAVNPLDKFSIMKEMLSLMEKPDRAELLKHQGRKFAAKFSWQEHADCYQNIYKTI